MAFLSSLNIAGSGLTAQKKRLDVITENIANRETTRTDEGGPYRRKLSVFREINSGVGNSFAGIYRNKQLDLLAAAAERLYPGNATGVGGVMVSEVIEDESEFIPVYDPGHPDADEDGYVMMPNVDNTVEMVDAMAASRSYSANVAAFDALKELAVKALELGR
ncbi:flagellar basal-body rod protein FlgC [Clostridia bacterium]|nr:flagellar basal-body rod protein FlgC [Clostridia bacterium]